MNRSKKIVIIAGIFFSFGIHAQENNSENNETEWSVEIDPATFAFSGYGVHLRIKPPKSEHILVGAGVYAMDFPDLIVDLNPENKSKGWNVRLNQGIGLFGEYHFSEVNKGFFIGTQLARQEYKIKIEKQVGSEEFSTFLGLAYAGYTIRPIENNGLYFKTWGGVGYTSKIGGENKLGSSEYEVSPVLMFAAVHLGYTF